MVLSTFLLPEERVNIFVGGDDNILFSDKPIDTQNISNKVTKFYNMKLNFNECDKYNKGDPSMQFLGSKWTVSGPERPLMRMILGCCM
jgi:hypothetical protein